MSHFDSADKLLAQLEGGYAPDDNGQGPVNFGITLDWLRSVEPTATQPTIKDMTPERARELRFEHWWQAPGWGSIENQRIATALYITAFNTGVPRAVKLMQKALNSLEAGLTEDGAMGPKTLRAIKTATGVDADWLAEQFKVQLKAFYRGLAEQNPKKYGDDLNGWLARADKL